MSIPGRFCERHWSWLCQAGQGKCQSDLRKGIHTANIVEVGETWSWHCSCDLIGHCVPTKIRARKNAKAHEVRLRQRAA